MDSEIWVVLAFFAVLGIFAGMDIYDKSSYTGYSSRKRALMGLLVFLLIWLIFPVGGLLYIYLRSDFKKRMREQREAMETLKKDEVLEALDADTLNQAEILAAVQAGKISNSDFLEYIKKKKAAKRRKKQSGMDKV